eukprot:2677249-Amphidinium_carterae.2
MQSSGRRNHFPQASLRLIARLTQVAPESQEGTCRTVARPLRMHDYQDLEIPEDQEKSMYFSSKQSDGLVDMLTKQGRIQGIDAVGNDG